MKIINENLIAHQGSDFAYLRNVKDDNSDPIDLAAKTLVGHIKKSWESSTYYEFEIVKLDAASGIISIKLPAMTSVGMVPGKYVYDIFMTEEDESQKLYEGLIDIIPSVTSIT